MCQGDLGEQTVLTPFEECAIDELTRGNPDAPAARAAGIYANRVARLALVLHELIEHVENSHVNADECPELNLARIVLEQESVAAARFEEVA